MRLNCKAGDLARVVQSEAGNLGKIVRCVRLERQPRVWVSKSGVVSREMSWAIDPPLPNYIGVFIGFISDLQLKPIGNPGDDAIDEMVKSAGNPNETVRECVEGMVR